MAIAGSVLSSPSGSIDLGLRPEMRRAQQRAVDVGGEIPRLAEIARAVAGHRHQRHQAPVAEQQHRGGRRLTPPAGGQVDQRGGEIAERDALEHARDAQRRPVEPRKAVEHDAQREDHRRAAQHAHEHGPAHPASRAWAQGQGNRGAHDEQEEGEDEIGGRPAMPVGVAQRRIDGAPGARIVHQHHGRHRDPAQGVEREEPRHLSTVQHAVRRTGGSSRCRARSCRTARPLPSGGAPPPPPRGETPGPPPDASRHRRTARAWPRTRAGFPWWSRAR